MEVDTWVHDLRDASAHVRDQGNRPTCLVMATSSAHQLTRAQAAPFAPDALWMHAVDAGATSDRGTTIAAIGRALQEWGQPAELDWPYELPSSSLVPPSTVGSPPWSTAVLQVDVATPRGALDLLSSGIVSVATLRVYDSFYLTQGARSLDVLEPSEFFYGHHAICIVGYVEDGGRRWFVIQNSWGAGWGDGGFALLSDRYLAATLVELAVVSPLSA